MSTPRLFTPIPLAAVTLINRIAVAPMCQYSATDGCLNDWHLVHLARLSLSGAGCVILEATAVQPEGRITDKDAGLWDDATARAAANVVGRVKRLTSTPLFVQLAHAGRKASVEVPWLGGGQIREVHARGWRTVAPSPIPHYPTEDAPLPLDRAAMATIRKSFAEAAARAMSIGLDGIELHAAHGYLLHQFLSPLSNRRVDDYGGSLEGRMRFPLEVLDAVRHAVPPDKPLIVRISATDWASGGWDIEQSLLFAAEIERRGATAIHVSSGGLSFDQTIPVGPGYQVPFARTIRKAVSLPVIAVGLITEPEQAEAIIASGDADIVALARGILYDPHWPWHAAASLGGHVRAPDQYLRSQPRLYPKLFQSPYG